jgi:hypothetical protein
MILISTLVIVGLLLSAVFGALGTYLWDLVNDYLDKEKGDIVPNTELTIDEVATELGVSLDYAQKLVDKLWLPFRYENGYRPIYKNRDVQGLKRKLEEMRMKGYWQTL